TVDIVHQLNQFDTPDNQKDSNGYPIAGASGTSETDLGFALPSGAYKISFRGNGRLDVRGIGQLAGPWQSVNNEQRNVVNITATPGGFGGVLDLIITNSPGQVVQDIHLLLPNYDYDSAQVFTPELLRVLAPFRSLRFTGWMLTGIGGSSLSDWSNRPRAS